jgi:hypothetical protein
MKYFLFALLFPCAVGAQEAGSIKFNNNPLWKSIPLATSSSPYETLTVFGPNSRLNRIVIKQEEKKRFRVVKDTPDEMVLELITDPLTN